MRSFEKYLNDYKVEKIEDGNGKITKKITYIGLKFRFRTTPEIIKRDKILFPVLSLVSLFLFLLPLSIRLPESHIFYVMLPMVLACIPLYFLIVASFMLLFHKAEYLTREKADKICDRIPNMLIVLLVCYGLTAAGFLYYRFVVREQPLTLPSVILGGCILAQFAITLFLRHLEKDLACEVIREPKC